MRTAAFFGAVLVAAATFVPPASADLGAVHPEVLKATAAVREAKGPEVYAALRDLWRIWDRADPAQVEAALESVVQSQTLSPPVRSYAELLGAYARRRRGDLDGALARVAKLGFVRRWLTIGPFDNENKAGFDRAYGPEGEQDAPISALRTYDGKERPVRWRQPPEVLHYGWFDFGDLIRPRENVCAYGTTFVRAKDGTRAPRQVSLWMGSAGAIRVLWNGEVVLEDGAYRELDIDRFATTVTLKAGQNRITVKVCGDDDAPKFTLRIADEQGAPDLGVEVSATLDAAPPARPAPAPKATTAPPPPPKPAPAKPPPSPAPKKPGDEPEKPVSVGVPNTPAPARPGPPARGNLLGPVQQFERATAGAHPPAPVLESYARYLAITGGDPDGEHKARDLARRAADAAPTVQRLLLAGDLAEDRNQQREWIRRAAELAGPRRDLDVLLKQAELERSGPNWRDAVPIYDRILAADPDHVSAILGRVEL